MEHKLEQSNQIQTHILNHLINNEDYCRRVIPFLKKDYFEGTHKVVFDLIVDFVVTHNKIPSGKVLEMELSKVNAPEDVLTQSNNLIQEVKQKSDIDTDYLINESEKWCKERAVYNAIMESIQIIDGKDKERSDGAIPDILSNALGVSFDPNIGHDYIDNSDKRFDFYNTEESRLPFDLDYFNKITKGGLPNKTLNIAMAGTGVGKSLFMCHCAASNLSLGNNVLYITMEMAEERIAERIDANLMDLPIQQLETLPKNVFDSKIQNIAQGSIGKLIVKEYPTGAAHTGHFRALLNELKLKKNFKPDIIYIDYLNICGSLRIRPGAGANSYTLVKSIAEEMRGLAVEYDVPIVSATQTTRSGFGSTDIGLEDTSESFGLPATADFMFALITSEELEELDQMVVKQLKNRYNDPTVFKRFVVGVDRSRMKFYDCEQEAQEELVDSAIAQEDDTPVMDRNEKFRDFKI